MNRPNTRMHVALAVRELEPAVAFYRRLFDQEPAKVRPGYAKFEVADPVVNFTLNETPAAVAPGLPQHLGIEFRTPAEVAAFARRAGAEGLATRAEDNVTCCNAVMDKIWLSDPDGHAWEVFAVTEADAPSDHRHATTDDTDGDAPCCAPTCCS